MKAVISILFVILFSQGFSQATEKQLKQLQQAAKLEFDYGDYPKAALLYFDILKIDSLNAEGNYGYGLSMHLLRKDPSEVLPYFTRAVNAGHTEALIYQGKMLHIEQKFEEAISAYQHYRIAEGKKNVEADEVSRLIQISKRAMELVSRPVIAAVRNLGDVINSPFPEYVPLVNADETVMIFTSRRPGGVGNKKDAYGNYFEDVYISRKVNGEWTAPQNAGAPVNTETHDACVSLSADGNVMFLFRPSEDGVSGDLYITRFNGEKWSDPVILPSQINSPSVESSACLSVDNTTIYFSSDRPGGFGGKDLYRCVVLPDGTWSMPLNLGPSINSQYDEDSPFIHPDNKTLYFSSSGHETMGGFDVFRSERKEDGVWTEPENIGYPLNSTGDDIFLVMSTDGKRAYYSSGKSGGEGSQDIYEASMNFQSNDLEVVPGQVRSKENKPVRATITLIDENARNLSGIYTSQASGKFILICNTKSRYKILAEADGYYPATQTLLVSDSAQTPIVLELQKK